MVKDPPNSGNLVLFFGRQKQCFARMMIMMIIMVILMIIMTKIIKKNIHLLRSLSKKCYFKDYYLVKKRGQKIRAWVDPPPPLFGQCPKENVFFVPMSSLMEYCHFREKYFCCENLVQIGIG